MKKRFFIAALTVLMLCPAATAFAGNGKSQGRNGDSRKEQNVSLRVLFIGDSVTDGAWGRSAGSSQPSEERDRHDLNHIFGHSYMMLCAARLGSENPEAGVEFMNRGISGDDISRMEQRWDKDVIALKPDVLSVLFGTNDVHYHLQQGGNGFDVAGWEKRYRALLDRVRAANPEVKLVLGTPFVAKAGWVGASDDYPERERLVSELGAAVGAIARDYNAVLLRYDSLFAAQGKAHPLVPMSHWIWDGIHPTAAGHQLMADLWVDRCRDILRAGGSVAVPVVKTGR